MSSQEQLQNALDRVDERMRLLKQKERAEVFRIIQALNTEPPKTEIWL